MTDTVEALGVVGQPLEPRGELLSGFLRLLEIPGFFLSRASEAGYLRCRVVLLGRSSGALRWLFHAPIMWLQIILDKPPAKVFTVATLNQEAIMAEEKDDAIPEALQILLQRAVDEANRIAAEFKEDFRGAEFSHEDVAKIANDIYEAMRAALTRMHGGSH